MTRAFSSVNLLPGLIVGGAWVLASGAASAQALQAYAGAVAGVAQGTGPFACATSGPTIGDGWFAGLRMPTEGFAGCNLQGGIQNQTGTAGTLTATQTAAGSVSGGSYTGSAMARAGYWNLGAAAEGTMTGSTSAFTYHQSSAFARFSVPVTLTSTGIATGSPGQVNFRFLVEGLMSSLPNAPYTQQGDVRLGIRVNGSPAGTWNAFMGTVVNDGEPYLRGGSTGLPGGFVTAPGAFSGSAEVTTTANFAMQWGVPFEVEVALFTDVYPCCLGASITSDFSQTAALTGIEAYWQGGRVTDFTGTDAVGNVLGPNGVVPVPEPASTALVISGLVCVAAMVRRQRGHRPALGWR